MKSILTTILISLLFVCCKNEPKTIPYTMDDIMVIYQHGYLTGQIEGRTNRYDWGKDSINFENKFKPLYK